MYATQYDHSARPAMSRQSKAGESSHIAPSNHIWRALALGAQPKWEVSQPGEPLEQEADQVAGSVMRMPEKKVQRECACAGESQPCPKCEAEKIQRKEDGGGATSAESPTANLSGGRPLDGQSRDFFEPRFGRSFENVRVHISPEAGQSAHDIGARAYTFGSDIVFAPGQYSPDSEQGQHLLAHELTHVTQQANGVQPKLLRDAERPITVTLRTTGACANDRDLAMAIPGAKSMAFVALNWLLSYSFMDEVGQMRIDALLRANFRSSSAEVRNVVRARISRAYSLLEAAQGGNLTFDCRAEGDPDCMQGETPLMGYVRESERNLVHICPAFFRATLEERRWNLIHECIHLAGARGPETYYFYFGEITDSMCYTQTELAADVALQNADNYARFIWCLTRPSGTVIRPVDPM